MTPNNGGKGPIFVTNADGDKGYAITQQMLQFPTKYPHLPRYPVYAGLPDDSTERAKSLATQGAQLRAFDIFNDSAAAVNALRDVAKLCLVVDPLSERISRANAFEYGKAFIDAAKEAQVEHVIFLTPFSPLDPVSPPSSPVADPATCISLNDPTTYRSQYMLIETYLRSRFETNRITILRYPGILYQHLKVFRKYIMENNAFPLSNQHLEFTVESSSMLDIAHATACIAHSPTLRHSSNVYKLTGPQLLTLEEVSARVLTGLRRDIAVNFMDIEALQNILTESVGNAEHVAFLLEVWGLQQKLGGSRFEITRDLEALTGQSGKTLNEYFEDDKVQEFFQSAMPSPFVA